MTTKTLKDKAQRLLELNAQIKALTEQADDLKKILRLNMPDGGLQLKNNFICKKVVQTYPEINNRLFFKHLTLKEIEKVTKPVLSELKKLLPDQYDKILDEATVGYRSVECIKFYCGKIDVLSDAGSDLRRAIDF